MRNLFRYVAIGSLLIGLPITPTSAQPALTGKPIPGYVCMRLNLSREQMTSRQFNVPVYAGPSEASERVGQASAVMIVRSPANVENGFAELLFFNGRRGWLQRSLLRPYKTIEAPNATCTPEILPNGRIGFG